jgi:DNA-binding response OmpR family regulator
MHILIVEDDHRIANAIKKGLEQEHFTVDVTFTGTEGFDLASTEQFDCIILDRMLPGMDGLTLCTKLRDQKIHTPILLLTAKTQTHEKVEGLDSGADDYLGKPFSFDELLARIHALIRRPHQVSSDILQLGDLSLNTRTFITKRGSQLIQLSQKEFTLLEYFLRHPNTVLTKEHLIEQVWNFDADILPNTIEVFIKNLRKKVDKPFSTSLIHTIRGFGYKLSLE